jgi:hypothetical protein
LSLKYLMLTTTTVWREPVGKGGGADWVSRAATSLALLTLFSSLCTEVPRIGFSAKFALTAF